MENREPHHQNNYINVSQNNISQNSFPVGCSKEHKKVIDTLSKIAQTDAEVLITGPSGVGKELYAQFVHTHSQRHDSPFVPVNCGALSEDLLENELFGHIGGAFTGAKPNSEGLIAAAEYGTLFLDEVDSLSSTCQVKLLRFLQDKHYRRLGENHLRKANIRIIAATNVDLEMAVRTGLFRKDLFFRLRVAPVTIAPLSDRPEDIMTLLDVFISKSAAKYGLDKITISQNALDYMQSYTWPGNIRELENCVCYLTCLQLERPIDTVDLPLLDEQKTNSSNTFEMQINTNIEFNELKQTLISYFEKQYLTKVLKRTHGNISAAARLSGKDRRAFFELVRKHKIDPEQYRKFEPDEYITIQPN